MSETNPQDDRAAALREAADEIAGIDFHPNARARSLDIAAGLSRRLRRMADEASNPDRSAAPAQQGEGWHVTPTSLDLFVRALVNHVDYDIHKGWECGEEDGEDHYPELVADAAEMLDAITAKPQPESGR